MHSCACVNHLPFVDGRWDGKGVQDPKGYATAWPKHSQNLFYYYYKKFQFLNDNILDHLLGVFMGH